MTKIKNIPSILAIVGLLFVTACDKERPYDEIENKNAAGDVQSKSDFDHMSQQGKFVVDNVTGQKFSLSNIDKLPTSKQYLAVVSTTSVDMDAPVTPYEMGREIRTVVSFDEDNLVAYEIPNQFNETDLNFKPFIKIPIEHIDYKCAEDANKKCTQKEIVDTEKAWVDKRFFVPSLEKLEVQSLSGFTSLIQYAIDCSKELDAKVISYKVEPDAINITIEKTMQQKFMCVGFKVFSNPSEVTYRMQQNISLVKLDTLVSKDYETMNYREIGPNEFGFFKTVYETKNESNELCRDCHKEFVSRWNPKKKVIDFHLSTNFDKPKNAGLKSATVHGIKIINEAFKEAGTDLQIKLHNGTNSLIEGDIRKNLIVMVEDPISRGLLGYGPSITNPMTGEIVHARTVMFPGVMKRFIERSYGEFLESVARAEQKKIEDSGVLQAVGGPRVRSAAEQAKVDRQLKALGYNASPLELNLSQIDSNLMSKNIMSTLDIVTSPVDTGSDDSQVKLLDRYFEVHGTEGVDLRNEIEELTTHNFYPAELFNTNEALGKELKQIIVENDYRTWDNLSPNVREAVVNRLLPIVWIPTFIHEIGHNLGLRHNFFGSNDKDNYYSEQELAGRGIHRKMEYSSIMDYGYSSSNELSIMGKYDVAALKFAYAEQVELKDGSTVSIHEVEPEEGTLAIVSAQAVKKLKSENVNLDDLVVLDDKSYSVKTEDTLKAIVAASLGSEDLQVFNVKGSQLKEFMYCSDEGVSLNANCNRFDQGTNNVEIVQTIIQDYEQYYKRRNTKRDKYDYNSTTGDLRALGSIRYRLNQLRLVFELYETIAVGNKEYFENNPDAWNTDPDLKDIKDATVLAGQFLIDIIKTPDVHCLIGEKKDGEVVPAAIIQLARLSSRDANCALAGEGLPEQFVVLGQAGKSFNHIRDKRNPNIYIDQINVRGFWIDKMMAIRTLFDRTIGLGNYDNITLNFMSVPELKKPIEDLITSLASDKVNGTLVFETNLGQPITIPWSYSLFKDETHKLKKHFHPVVRWYFGLSRGGPTQFQSLAISYMKNRAASRDDHDTEIGRALVDSLDVYKSFPNGEDEDNLVMHRIGTDRFFAYEENTIARSTMKQLGEQDKANKLNDLVAAGGEVATAEVNAILENRKLNPDTKAPDEATPLQKLAFDIDIETLEASLEGLLLPNSYYEMVLKALAQ